jgi:hypothetical protein
MTTETNTNENRKEYLANYRKSNKEKLAEKRRVKNQLLIGTQSRTQTRRFFAEKKVVPGVVIINGPVTITFD